MLLSCCSLVDDNTKLQSHNDILSLVVKLPSNHMLYSLGKRIVDRLISSPVGSKDGIHATIDTPYGKNPMMNVYQPHVLRQYFSKNVDTKPCKDGYIYRYSYGTGTGSNTLGIDPTNFMTRPFSHEIDVMAKKVHEFVNRNRKRLNLTHAELGEGYNHMTIILYYAGEGLKKVSLLSKHCDCTYSVHNGKYILSANSQVENTPTIVYSLGSARSLNFNRREIVKGKRGNKWLNDTEWSTTFELENNSIWINNPADEEPSPRYQYQHGGVKVGEGELSIGFAFRNVNCVQEYNVMSDLRSYDVSASHEDNSKVYKRFMSHQETFHENLVKLMNQILD